MMLRTGDGIEQEGAWKFTGVAPVFDSHVRRSVPAFDGSHDIASAVIASGSWDSLKVLDLGSSTGTFAIRLAQMSQQIFVRGIDCEQEMVDVATQKSAGLSNCEFKLGDIREADFSGFDFVVSHFSLQFLTVRDRRTLWQKIAGQMDTGSTLLLFEKFEGVAGPMNEWLRTFKSLKGLSDQEIRDKEESLRGVLHPFHDSEVTSLQAYGFDVPSQIWQGLQFKGFTVRKGNNSGSQSTQAVERAQAIS